MISSSEAGLFFSAKIFPLLLISYSASVCFIGFGIQLNFSHMKGKERFMYPVHSTHHIWTSLYSRCSGALEILISAIASVGQNILVPRPGFPLYSSIAESRNIEVRMYDLDVSFDLKPWNESIPSELITIFNGLAYLLHFFVFSHNFELFRCSPTEDGK